MTSEITRTQQTEIDEVALSTLMPPGSTKTEMGLFIEVCKRTRLDPFSRQIYPMKRYDSLKKKEVLSFQISIDGFRVVAERNGQYAGQDGPYWCGKDGQWVDVWLSEEPPLAAKVGVRRTDFKEPIYSVAKFEEYAQKTREGALTSMWKKMAANQIAKCAEALALRRAFPNDLSGLYTTDEMAQTTVAEAVPAEQPKTKEEKSSTKQLQSLMPTKEVEQKQEPIEAEYEVVSDEPPVEDRSEKPFGQATATVTQKLKKLIDEGQLDINSGDQKVMITIMTMHGILQTEIAHKFKKYAEGNFRKTKWAELTDKEKLKAMKDAVEGLLIEPIPF